MLNNMKYWLHTFLFSDTGVPYATTNSSANYKTPLMDVNGESVTNFNAVNSRYCSVLGYMSTDNKEATKGISIRLGTGLTVKTTDETYCLENESTDSFIIGNIASGVDAPDGKVRLLLTANYTNNTDEPITVNEIGIGFFNSRVVSGTTYYNQILLDRKSVADENFTHVTVGAGESKVFVYAIEL